MEQNAVGGEQVLDPNVLSRLCLAREALDAGFQAARDPLAYARMRAVLAFDEAIELVVVTLLPPSGNPPKLPKPGKPLDEYLALLVHGYPELAAHLAPVGRVRRNRNAVKHEGSVASFETVQESATAADHFIRSAVRAALRLELEEVTPLTLVSGRVEPDYGTDLKQTKDEAVFVVDFVIRALARFDDWLRKNPRHRRDV